MLAVLLLFAAYSAITNCQINAPVSAVQCQYAGIQWNPVSIPPCYISLLPGGQVAAAAIEDIGTFNGTVTSVNWLVDIPAGTSLTLQLRDGTGATIYSGMLALENLRVLLTFSSVPFTIQPSSDSSCLGTNQGYVGGDGLPPPASGSSSSSVSSATATTNGDESITPSQSLPTSSASASSYSASASLSASSASASSYSTSASLSASSASASSYSANASLPVYTGDPNGIPTETPQPTPAPKSLAGPIAGGVVGGVAALAILAGLVFYCMRRKRGQPVRDTSDDQTRYTTVEIPHPTSDDQTRYATVEIPHPTSSNGTPYVPRMNGAQPNVGLSYADTTHEAQPNVGLSYADTTHEATNYAVRRR